MFVTKRDKCEMMQSLMEPFPPLPATHFCAGGGPLGQMTCAGDSGGPVVRRTPKGDVLVSGA